MGRVGDSNCRHGCELDFAIDEDYAGTGIEEMALDGLHWEEGERGSFKSAALVRDFRHPSQQYFSETVEGFLVHVVPHLHHSC